ncbi:prepilin peptidase [Alteriqipengyuania flavescens]|uniref:A24 family peptidase n=1 Tax=Alteriqipengyuania flavescens TaxID=3053610 RepID=UPI0025B5C06C|nr:prepilin peptidase [Alteriqipengyuania flavescens]WJY19117.1 prepilin peptidase [Alteriqipengyuania flavescens]WJY25058.1 prepilin peptidase [Alteriqipengyuania flavescens]
MPGFDVQYVLLAALAIALVIAAFTDIKERRIANWLTGSIAVCAPLFWWATGLSLWPGVALQFGVAIAAFAVFAALFAMKWMGGGDVKLLTALALWVEPTMFLRLIVFMALIGGVLTLLMGMWHIMRRQRERLAIPYGVAISSAGLWVLGSHYIPQMQGGIAG